MAAAPDPDEVLRSTTGKSNFQLVARLLISGGTTLLREVFDQICPPTNLPTILKNPATEKQLKAAKLTKPQWDCLYPSPGVYGKSTDFDVTLLFRLLRSICNLQLIPPAMGWDALPAITDHSLAADLARIKYYRNAVYGHVSQNMEITDDEFPQLWQEISDALIRIAAQLSPVKKAEWQKAIDNFLKDPLTAEDERNVGELLSWYRNDMERLETSLKRAQEATKEVQEGIECVQGGLEGTTHVLETAVREEAQEMKDQLGELHQSIYRLSSSARNPQAAGARLRLQIVSELISGLGPLGGSSEGGSNREEVLNLAASKYVKTIDPSKPDEFKAFFDYLEKVRTVLISDHSGDLPSSQEVLGLAALKYLETINPSEPDEFEGFMKYLQTIRSVLFSDHSGDLPSSQEVLGLAALKYLETTDPSEPDEFEGFVKYLQTIRSVLFSDHSVDESFVLRAIMKFEAKHEECLRVCPYIKNGKVVVHFYVYSGKSGIPPALKTAARECFGEMGVKLEWSDLYNDAYNVLNVTPIEYPSGEPNRLEASQIDKIDEIINKNLHLFSKHRNITALQPSFKVTKSVQTEEACITVYVLGKGDIPIGESAIPSTIGSYPVDVVNGFCVRTKEPKKPTKAQKQKKIISLGASIGVDGEQSSGTLGAVVEDANSGTLYALSCDHVMSHADTSEIIHPGLDVYLNYLHYHLNEYKKWIDRITEPNFELPQISADILQEPEKLLEKFNELKTIKETNSASTRSSEDTLKNIRKHEEVLEESFLKPPRIIANYSAGIRHNVVSAKYGKEHFIDSAISELKQDEQSNLKRSKTTEIIESGHYPSGECVPATTKATMSVEELFKSGSATGFTESNLLVGASISPPMTIQAFRRHDGSAWIDVECLICERREAAQSQDQELSSPCEVCKPHRWLKSCLCIQKQGPGSFSDHGDSGAVIFEKRRKQGSEDYQTTCPGFGIIFAVHKSSYFDFTIASPLEIALEALSQKVSDLRSESKPCELRLTSKFN